MLRRAPNEASGGRGNAAECQISVESFSSIPWKLTLLQSAAPTNFKLPVGNIFLSLTLLRFLVLAGDLGSDSDLLLLEKRLGLPRGDLQK